VAVTSPGLAPASALDVLASLAGLDDGGGDELLGGAEVVLDVVGAGC
jgi:hypothetical protein